MDTLYLTAETLREVLDYNPENGSFTWKINAAKSVKAGSLAGNISKKGYVTIGYLNKIYKAHRLAWLHTYGVWPAGLIDHINGKKADNRIDNLRVVDASGNSQNVRKPNARNKSGFIGVIAFQNKWRASITIAGKTRRIGDYSTPEKAHQAYLEAKRTLHSVCTI
jgi:hypothetical protein